VSHSEQLDKILPAILDVQSNVKPIAKDDVNPHFGHKFASLGAINEAIQPLLTKNQLVVTHTLCVLPDGSSGLKTTLWHVSGQWIRGEMPLLLAKEDPQGQGSGITYARRYALAALLNLVQADDDGNQATQSRQNYQAQAPRQQSRSNARKPECIGCGLVQPVMKSQYGSGWYCNKKQGGCGAKFEDNDSNVFANSSEEEREIDRIFSNG